MSDANFVRLLRLLQLIPAYPRTVDTTMLANQLAAEGTSTTARTIQRDLVKLEGMGYGLECLDESKPYRWRYLATAKPVVLPGLDLPQALALLTVESHLQHLLPRSALHALKPHLAAARKLVDGKPARRWLERVRVVSRAQPLAPPRVELEVADAVQLALFEEKTLEVRYRKADGSIMEMTLHPLGLVLREAVSYLVALAFGYSDVRLYALHRMTKATVGDDAARTAPEGFNLDDFIDNGEPGWRLTPTPIELELRFFNGAGRGVTESPLAKDQTVQVDGDVVTVTATVVDTRVLRAWLLGFGPGVEVVRPTSLRSELQEAMKAAATRYK